MPFDLKTIQAELAEAPPQSPVHQDLAIAVINDTLRDASQSPIDDESWARIVDDGRTLQPEQLSMLGHALVVSPSLREATIEGWPAEASRAVGQVRAFFKHIAPLTAEMIRANAFRQEEFLRRWAECVGGPIAGESQRDSKKRLGKLDYRAALKELKRAEEARKKEEERRAKLRAEAEARRRASEARSWRE